MKNDDAKSLSIIHQSSLIKAIIFNRKMATAKLTWFIIDLLGFPVWLAGIMSNLDNWKSLILMLIGCIYAGLRTYFYYVQKEQSVREKELELKHKELDWNLRQKKQEDE